MQLRCPNNHLAVVREDPDSTHQRAMCDFCGWSAAFAVSRDDADYRPNGNAQQLEQAQDEEQTRRQLQPAGGSQSRRRAD